MRSSESKDPNHDDVTPRLNKSAWIRSKDRGIPARELVNQAKNEGFKLSLAHVYNARNSATKSSSRTATVTKPAPRRRPGRETQEANIDAFKRLVLQIGFDQADAYLRELKRSVGL